MKETRHKGLQACDPDKSMETGSRVRGGGERKVTVGRNRVSYKWGSVLELIRGKYHTVLGIYESRRLLTWNWWVVGALCFLFFVFLCGFPLNEECVKASSLTGNRREWTKLAGWFAFLFVSVCKAVTLISLCHEKPCTSSMSLREGGRSEPQRGLGAI